jgi:hypothetical protein
MRLTVEPLSLSRISRRAAFAVSVAVLATGFALGAARAEDKAAMLLPGSVNDQSWNAIGFAALNKLKDQGADIAYSENVSPADQIETMKDYARRGFSPVIGHSGRFLSAAQRVGPEFDKTWFLIASAAQGAGKNVAALDYNNTWSARLQRACRKVEKLASSPGWKVCRTRCNTSAVSVSAPRRRSPTSRSRSFISRTWKTRPCRKKPRYR